VLEVLTTPTKKSYLVPIGVLAGGGRVIVQPASAFNTTTELVPAGRVRLAVALIVFVVDIRLLPERSNGSPIVAIEYISFNNDELKLIK
jgi:hypothetical protein